MLKTTTQAAPLPTPELERTGGAPVRVLPSVSVVIVNFNGKRHLEPCLDSLGALDYPVDRLEVVVVDNGSHDGSRDYLRDRYPGVRLVSNDRNVGFAEAVNIGAQHSTADCIALLNNDMRVDQSWLRELVSRYEPDTGCSCVAGHILDWDGTHVDFMGGVLNFHGFGEQPGFGRPVEDVAVTDGIDLPFACGGSMLVSRELFVESGGFDKGFFAYFEDVDFGWRLRLLGHSIRFAAKAKSFHRHHGTSGGLASYKRTLLYERNALRSMLKNLDDENLPKLLGPALLLLIARAMMDSGSNRSEYHIGATEGPPVEPVMRDTMSRLHAACDVIHDIENIMAERRRIQLARRVPDDVVFESFGYPFKPLGRGDDEYVELMEQLTRNFRLEDVFQRRRVGRVMVVAYDRIGTRMAGPGVRSWEIACALSSFVDVTVASTSAVDRRHPGVETLQVANSDELVDLTSEFDLVVVHGYALQEHPTLRFTRALLVVDLYDPWAFENLELLQPHSNHTGDWALRRDIEVMNDLIDCGDFFVCASERQRDYWLGMLTARGRVDRASYQHDADLRTLIDVLPYGCPELPPERKGVLKGVHPAIAEDDILLIWSGGAWEWFDPLLVIEAFYEAQKIEPRLRLYFMGMELDGRNVPTMGVVERVRSRSDELGLTDSRIVFGNWAPYDDRGAYLVEADAAIVATKQLAEVRLAFRSRVLDHFWAGLPTITTGGDVIADAIDAHGAGIVVPVGEADALRDAMLAIADPGAREAMSRSALKLADRYRWQRSVEALRPIVDEPWRWRALREQRFRPIELTDDARQAMVRYRHRAQAAMASRRAGRRALRRAHGTRFYTPTGSLSLRLKRTRWYPALRSIRRSKLGQRLFGHVA